MTASLGMDLPSTAIAPAIESSWSDLLRALHEGDAAGVEAATTTFAAADERDELLALSVIHDLHLAPLDSLGEGASFQHHPGVAVLKHELEQRMLTRLRSGEHRSPQQRRSAGTRGPAEAAVQAMRSIAASELVPAVYHWVAESATFADLQHFLAFEGGPDGGFDDLVAIAQVGLVGEPKLEMARNYWDEMGGGHAADVHTELHRQMASAARLRTVPRSQLPTEALARSVLGSLLATNRSLQPELVGALGLLELQAGPRCRKVLVGLERVGADPAALPFYVEHAQTDPRHGKDWLDHVIRPLAADERWSTGLVRGAAWRAQVNQRFFSSMADRFGVSRCRSDR